MFAQGLKQFKSSFIRDILAVTQQPQVISLAGGLPDPALFPLEQLKIAADGIHAKVGSSLYQYSATEGLSGLRDYIAASLSDVELQKSQILITTGAQQGLDLISRILLAPGSTVVLEAPAYLGALQVFGANQAKIHSIASGPDGPDLDALEFYAKTHQIQCFYTVSDFHNPTGVCYSLAQRQRLLDLAERYDFWILEDAPYRALRYTGETLPSLQSLSPGRVIQLGSFSKIIAPGLRLGWISANQEVIKSAVNLKQATDLHSSAYDQHLILGFLLQGYLPDHLQRLKSDYAGKMNLMGDALESQLGEKLRFKRPDGGMFIWATLDPGIDTHELFDRAITKGVAFVPGAAFYENNSVNHSMRLNFTNSSEDDILKGINRLAGLIKSTGF
jgi:2-aminoadipate transaminase